MNPDITFALQTIAEGRVLGTDMFVTKVFAEALLEIRKTLVEIQELKLP